MAAHPKVLLEALLKIQVAPTSIRKQATSLTHLKQDTSTKHLYLRSRLSFFCPTRLIRILDKDRSCAPSKDSCKHQTSYLYQHRAFQSTLLSKGKSSLQIDQL
jgi:hypothetical protein